MKKILSLLVAGSLITGTITAQEVTNTDKGTVYGASFKTEKPISTKNFHKKLKKTGKKVPMVVEGTVKDVCTKKGCWINVVLNDGTVLFIKMKDYAFFVPKAGLEGKTVQLKGEGFKEVFSVEELQHYAADGGKSKEEIAKITEPETKYRFTATGIQVMN